LKIIPYNNNIIKLSKKSVKYVIVYVNSGQSETSFSEV